MKGCGENGETAAAVVVQLLLALMPVFGKSQRSTSCVMYLVKMSAGLSFPGILCIVMMPACTKFWMNMNFSSMCFAFLDTPWRDAMDLPAELSVWILMLSFLCWKASLMKFRMKSAS